MKNSFDIQIEIFQKVSSNQLHPSLIIITKPKALEIFNFQYRVNSNEPQNSLPQ